MKLIFFNIKEDLKESPFFLLSTFLINCFCSFIVLAFVNKYIDLSTGKFAAGFDNLMILFFAILLLFYILYALSYRLYFNSIKDRTRLYNYVGISRGTFYLTVLIEAFIILLLSLLVSYALSYLIDFTSNSFNFGGFENATTTIDFKNFIICFLIAVSPIILITILVLLVRYKRRNKRLD
jgi:hypothetical protein